MLLAAGADVGARDVAGQTPLHWATLADAVAVAAALLDRGADLRAQAADGAQPVHTAALRNAPAVLGVLLDRGADIEAGDGNGRTPFHWAAAREIPAWLGEPAVFPAPGTDRHVPGFRNAAVGVRPKPQGPRLAAAPGAGRRPPTPGADAPR